MCESINSFFILLGRRIVCSHCLLEKQIKPAMFFQWVQKINSQLRNGWFFRTHLMRKPDNLSWYVFLYKKFPRYKFLE